MQYSTSDITHSVDDTGQRPKTHWPSVLQFVLSSLGTLILWITALFSLTIGIFQVFSLSGLMDVALAPLMSAAAAFAGGLLLIPSAVLAYRRMTGRTQPSHSWLLPRIPPTRLILFLPLILLAGFLVNRYTDLAWLVLPVMHILATTIIVAWLLYLGVRQLQLGSPQRAWGVFSSGLVLGPGLIMIAELTALIGLFVIGISYLFSQPELTDELIALSENLTLVPPTPEALTELLLPYLTNPTLIFAGLAFIAVLVPLIEEALKPIGVWLLVGRDLTPQAGFAAGALSGAGYALFESLFLTTTGSEWASVVVARIGTALIHILNTGLMGWALVLAWKNRRYLRLGLTYLFVVALHGLWNGFTIILSITQLVAFQNTQTNLPLVDTLGQIAPYALVAISVGAFALLLSLNKSFRAANQPERKPEIPEPMIQSTAGEQHAVL